MNIDFVEMHLGVDNLQQNFPEGLMGLTRATIAWALALLESRLQSVDIEPKDSETMVNQKPACSLQDCFLYTWQRYQPPLLPGTRP